MNIFLQLILGWLYSHFFEYVAHRWVLHNHKIFKFAFKNHFARHHYISRKNEMYDENYEKIINNNNLFEPVSLTVLLIAHLPVAFYFPFFFLAILYSSLSYYIIHRKSHIDVGWGKKWLPWHAEHHMGKNQHINWGVRLPIMDMLFRTSKYNTS